MAHAASAGTDKVGRTRPSPHTPAVSAGLTLFALAVAGLVVSVQQTLVLPLLPSLMRAFHTSVSSVTWVFTATLLAGAVATPLLARFGDMYGKKKMIVLAMVLLIAGSAVCALSNTLGVLIVGRALQGTSAAVIPLAIGVIRDVFPRERVMASIGILSATLGMGGAAGMLVTGVVAEHTSSYRPIFWIATGVGVLGLILVAAGTPRVGARAGGSPDLLGALFLGAWLVCLLLAISYGNDWGWESRRIVGLFGAAAVLCMVWVVIEVVVRQPLVKLGLLVGRRSLTANVAGLMLGFALFASFTLIANFVETPRARFGYGLSGSVLDVGLYMLPSTVAMLLFSALAGRFERRLGAAFTLAIGSLVTGGGYVWLAVANSSGTDLMIFSGIQGVGVGIGYAALGTLAVQHVPMGQSGIASGINTLVRTTGGSIAGAATASVLTAHLIRGTAVPTLHGYVLCFVVAAAGAGLATLTAVVHGILHRGDGAPAGPPVEIPRVVQVNRVTLNGDAMQTSRMDTTGPGVYGRVAGPDGREVAGAVLAVTDLAGRQIARGFSEHHGAYGLPLPHGGTYLLVCSADGHQPVASHVSVGAEAVRFDLTLAGGGAVQGRVLRGGGEPIADATVTLTDVRGEVVGATVTGVDGTYLLSGLYPGEYTLAAIAEGALPVARAIALEGSGTHRFDVVLRSQVCLAGTVRAAGSRLPVSEASVTLVDTEGNVAGAAVTGIDGRYEFTDLQPGPYSLTASGYAPVALRVELHEDRTDQDVELGAPAQAAALPPSPRLDQHQLGRGLTG